ncbi:MAG: hypothetical protein V6Z82_04785 [Flavobacteriales bacterium]
MRKRKKIDWGYILLAVACLLIGCLALVTRSGDCFMALAAATVAALPLKDELAERELIKKFRHANTWLVEIRSKPKWVGKDVIKIPKRGVAPKVLINNKIYPIVSNKRDDTYIAISLNKYDTTNTTVTDDELYALPYEKLNDVQLQHREELEDKTAEHALYSLAPSKHSTQTPVLETTGPADETGRKRLVSKDLIHLQKTLGNLNVPKEGRILVLSPDHVADLLLEDRKFETQYHNAKAGVLAKMYYGFKVYESNYTPCYTDRLVKRSFDSVEVSRVASVVFHKRTTVKATGSVKRYAQAAKDSPDFRENKIGFRLHFICVGIEDLGQAVLVSGKESAEEEGK